MTTSEPGPIAARARACAQGFESILTNLPSSWPEAQKQAIDDNVSRFRLWAGNIGALHIDARSADHRVREAPEIAERVLDLLGDIQEGVEDLGAITSGQQDNRSRFAEDDRPSSEANVATTEFEEICLTISDATTSLLRVSGFLRKATGRDRYAKASGTKGDPFPPNFDSRHVGDKFPQAPDALQKRLGLANAQRRQYLRYARMHRDRLGHEPADVTEVRGGPLTMAQREALAAALSSKTQLEHPAKSSVSSRLTLAVTEATTLDAEIISRAHLSTLEDDDFDDKTDTTSVVTSTAGEHSEGELRVMRLSEISKDAQDGKPFECPNCWTAVRFRKQRAWRRHVLRDVRAWTCTFSHCSSLLFEDRDSWFQHELDHHRRQWTCQSCARCTFGSESAMRHHLVSAHPENHESVLQAAINASSNPVAEITANACPFCDEWRTQLATRASAQGLTSVNDIFGSLNDFRRHLGSHLEQVALFTIPPRLERSMESGPGSESGGESDQGSSHADNEERFQHWHTELVEAEQLPPEAPRVDHESIHYEHQLVDADSKVVDFVDEKVDAGFDCPIRAGPDAFRCHWMPLRDSNGFPQLSRVKAHVAQHGLQCHKEECGRLFSTYGKYKEHVGRDECGDRGPENKVPLNRIWHTQAQIDGFFAARALGNRLQAQEQAWLDGFKCLYPNAPVPSAFYCENTAAHVETTSQAAPIHQNEQITADESALPSRRRPAEILQELARQASPGMSSSRNKDYHVTPASSEQPHVSSTSHNKLCTVDNGRAKLVADVNIPVESSKDGTCQRQDPIERGRDRTIGLQRNSEHRVRSEYRSYRRMNVDDEGAYSYMDPATMYRETVPAWRETDPAWREARPRRGSADDTIIARRMEMSSDLRIRPPVHASEGVPRGRQLHAPDPDYSRARDRIDYPSRKATAELSKHFQKAEMAKHSQAVTGVKDNIPQSTVQSAAEDHKMPRSILKVPKPKFPEDSSVVRDGIAPKEIATKTGIPPSARWTKIDRRLVSPEALEAFHERFEERLDCVIVLRVLTKEEIGMFAEITQKIRGERQTV